MTLKRWNMKMSMNDIQRTWSHLDDNERGNTKNVTINKVLMKRERWAFRLSPPPPLQHIRLIVWLILFIHSPHDTINHNKIIAWIRIIRLLFFFLFLDFSSVFFFFLLSFFFSFIRIVRFCYLQTCFNEKTRWN